MSKKTRKTTPFIPNFNLERSEYDLGQSAVEMQSMVLIVQNLISVSHDDVACMDCYESGD